MSDNNQPTVIKMLDKIFSFDKIFVVYMGVCSFGYIDMDIINSYN